MPDILALCRHFYASNYLPLGYYENEQPLYCAGFYDDVPLYDSVMRFFMRTNQTPAVYTMSDTGIYGFVRVYQAGGFLLVGPIFSNTVTTEIIHAYMSANFISREKEQDIEHFLCAIPHCSYNHFLNLLAFLHLCFNDEEIKVTEHFAVSDMTYEKEIAAHYAKDSYLARDEQQLHGTYFFEQQLLEYVRQGNPGQMRRFLQDTLTKQKLIEGKLADSPIRQAKNIFIGTITMVGKAGAIPGGMDIEQTYQLIDIYIQECERLQSLDEIKNLQFNMLMDFTNRVAGSKLPDGVSNEIFDCLQYIGANLTEIISVQDVADYIRRSRAYIADKFKRETGKNVGEYITDLRMKEAKTLLKYTDKSLAEISEYLHFSSQPYFQNVFKRKYGITPLKYREQRR